jgi:hypothetical protein
LLFLLIIQIIGIAKLYIINKEILWLPKQNPLRKP